MQHSTVVEEVSKIVLEMGRVLLPFQIRIGKAIFAEVGTGAISGSPKGTKKGTKRDNSVTTLCKKLAEQVYKSTGAKYSSTWFMYCYVYATSLSDTDVDTILRHTVTQNWLHDFVAKPEDERAKILAELNTCLPIHLAKVGKNLVRSKRHLGIDQGADPSDSVMLSCLMPADEIANKVAYIISRIRDFDKRTQVKKEIEDVFRRIA